MSKPVKATPFTVGDNTDEPPRVKAPTRVPVVTTSASPEISVAVPWVMVAACSATALLNKVNNASRLSIRGDLNTGRRLRPGLVVLTVILNIQAGRWVYWCLAESGFWRGWWI